MLVGVRGPDKLQCYSWFDGLAVFLSFSKDGTCEPIRARARNATLRAFLNLAALAKVIRKSFEISSDSPSNATLLTFCNLVKQAFQFSILNPR
jgi:hypothetical protein